MCSFLDLDLLLCLIPLLFQQKIFGIEQGVATMITALEAFSGRKGRSVILLSIIATLSQKTLGMIKDQT